MSKALRLLLASWLAFLCVSSGVDARMLLDATGAGKLRVPGLLDQGRLTLAGGAPRVGILDASYWTRTSAANGAVLSRPDPTGYDAALKNSSIAKTIPVPPSSVYVPVGGIGYVSIKHEAVNADTSPPLYINWDGHASQPSAANPVAPTVWYSSDSVTGSPDDGTWTQDTSFAVYRPNTSTALVGTGQRYFWPTAPSRWVQVRYDATGLTQQFVPHVACSSGEWVWVVGMSIIRNQFTNISGVAAARSTFIAAAPGTDPFFFVSARSGANQQAIINEQITPILASSVWRRFVRAVYTNTAVNDVAYAGTRDYASQSAATIDGIRGRFSYILNVLRDTNLTVVVPDLSFLNFTSADATNGSLPYVNSDFQSPNGAFPYNRYVFGPLIKSILPGAWDFLFDIPQVSDYAGLAEKYETDTPYAIGDSVHPSGAGYTSWRTRRAPLDRVLAGMAPGQNTLQTRLAALGASTTLALQARLLAVFDATFAMYPTTDTAAQARRDALRAQLVALPAS